MALAIAGLAALRLLVRPRLLTWGATPGEARGAMPGDDVVPRPHVVATRAVTVEAAPADIWPLLPALAGEDAAVVEEVPGRSLVMAVHAFHVSVTWAMELRERDGHTRLVVRERILCRPGLLGLIYRVLSDIGDFFPVRRRLAAIKAAAEGTKPVRAPVAVP
jgi:hypothetical protein